MINSVTVTAPGRIDLVAGPTDWCGGNTLSMAINLRAKATVTKLLDEKLISIEIDTLKEDYYTPIYDGKLDLFKAVIELTGLTGFAIKYETEIPKGSGLGGSAPLTVATVMALNKLFSKGWSKYYMTELAQRAETYKLKTVNGYQDQYSAMFGGLLFMNFDGKKCQRGDYSKTVEEEPYATVEELGKFLPNFHIVVAVPDITRSGSDQTNGSLSDRYLNGESKIVEAITKMTANGKMAKKAIVDENTSELYRLINEDCELLRLFGFLTTDNEEIIKSAKNWGSIAAKTCGAGRGAVAIFAPDSKTQERIYEKLQNMTLIKHIYKSQVDEGARYES